MHEITLALGTVHPLVCSYTGKTDFGGLCSAIAPGRFRTMQSLTFAKSEKGTHGGQRLFSLSSLDSQRTWQGALSTYGIALH